KDYSASFIKKNRASSVSIMAAAFISALFLSLLCSLFFNLWNYEVEQIVLEEGDWQGRITGEINEDDLSLIQNFANVEKAIVNEKLSEGPELVVDVYFQNTRTIYQDMPLITEKLGLDTSAASCHELLLSRYLIHDPQDEEPPLLMAFYLVLLMIMSMSLILIIHNSFAVSMNARIHQFGILSSIGATPGQIRTCLMQEAAALCAVPILLGSFLGIVLCFGTIHAMNFIAADVAGRHEAVFRYHPLVFAASILVSVLTVLISAWLPAGKLSRLTPLEAIRNTGGLQLKKKKHSRILSLLFGIEGELAGNALKAQKKALRTSTLSFTLSFLGFTVMLCFFTLSGISTKHTYFERYQDVWDVMVTVKDAEIENIDQLDEIRELPGVRSSVAYQKAAAVCSIPETDISDEVNALGGLETVAGSSVIAGEGSCLVQAPVVIMDDAGFEEYCEQIGVTPETNGVIVLNCIWDSINSNFRYKEYVPFIKEEHNTVTLQNAGQAENSVEIPVLGFTQEAPVLREEYADYALVQFMPLSVWKKNARQIGNTEADTYIRVLAENGITPAALNTLESDIAQKVGREYTIESENRIQEKIDNDHMIQGYMVMIGALCALLAMIGIANVFSNALGFLRQRRREFAQYMSVGMTPESMRKMFCIEALVIAGRPLLITLPLTVLFVGFMISASYLNPVEFLAVAPIVPTVVFILAIFGFVSLAYYIGGKRMLNCSLADALRNDSAV
ncbi:MAG: ABC transporter permease, partial [Lachnospiraceae bacterium]|nr:ABC transporter permease [Lachnospiraceae bacterium]